MMDREEHVSMHLRGYLLVLAAKNELNAFELMPIGDRN